MSKILNYVLIAIMISSINSTCTNGACTDCNTADSKCTVCANTSQFTLTDGECKVKDVPECGTDSTSVCKCDGKTLQKIAGKYNCVEKIDNCIYSIISGKCSTCESDYYSKDGVCTKVETLIDNCLYYSDLTKCLECKSDFVLSSANTSCTAVTQSACPTGQIDADNSDKCKKSSTK